MYVAFIYTYSYVVTEVRRKIKYTLLHKGIIYNYTTRGRMNKALACRGMGMKPRILTNHHMYILNSATAYS